VIISSDIFNRHAPTVNIVPLTSVIKEPFPSEFIIEPSNENNLSEKSRYLGSQIMTIDTDFFRGKIGILEEKYRNLSRESTKLVLDI
jgi:mRNA-degrading endonuclease toxin of MazEF toxin-antitoxin module